MRKAEAKAAAGESTVTARGGELKIEHKFKGEPRKSDSSGIDLFVS